MTKIPIGLIIKKIVKQKRLSVSQISNDYGIPRQTIYNTFTRTTMDLEEIDKWSEILETTRKELIDQSEGTESTKSTKSLDNGAFGDDTITRLNEEMSRLRETFTKELEAKNVQIAKLQDTVTTLLGKSEGVILDRFDLGKGFFLWPSSIKVGNTPFSTRY